MPIIRTQHKKSYSKIDNFIHDDRSLSFTAKGIYFYCLSRPNDWQFSEEEILSRSTDSRDIIRKAIHELQDAGYLIKHQPTVKGVFQKSVWTFHEIPLTHGSQPSTDIPSTAQNTVKEDIYATNALTVGSQPSTDIPSTALESDKTVFSSENALTPTFQPSTDCPSAVHIYKTTEKENNSKQVYTREKPDESTARNDAAAADVNKYSKQIKGIMGVISSESIPLDEMFITGMVNSYGPQLVIRTIEEMYPEQSATSHQRVIRNPPGLFTYMIKNFSFQEQKKNTTPQVPATPLAAKAVAL